MSDLKTRVREELIRRAGTPGLRSMPAGTRRRVKRGRVVRAIAATLVVASVAAFTAAAVSSLRREGVNPLDPDLERSMERVPDGWPVVDVLPTEGDEPAIVRGMVDGWPFRLIGQEGNHGPCLLLVLEGLMGTAEHLTCASDAEAPVPASSDLDNDAWAGLEPGSDDDVPVPGIQPNVGFVSERVKRLGFYQRGREWDLAILTAPDGWQVRPFVFFAPVQTEGSVFADGAGGEHLAEVATCITSEGEGMAGCYRLSGQIAEIPGTFTPPPAGAWPPPPQEVWAVLDPIAIPRYRGDVWIEPTFGGDFVPYVDWVEPNDTVAGKKYVLTYGEVGGDRFSLVIFDTKAGGDYGAGGAFEFSWGYHWDGESTTQLGASEGSQGLSARLRDGYDISAITSSHTARSGERFAVFTGPVSRRVDHVIVRLEDGWTQRVSVLWSDAVPGTGWLLAFIPPGIGEAVPVTAEGAELRRWPICRTSGGGPPTCPDWYRS